jgi:CO/xanthine dehydrogenase FAD-binding subunit
MGAFANATTPADKTAMDLNAITSISRPRDRAELGRFGGGDAWLAGGTWLYSEPQPRLRRLIDLTALDWTPLAVSEAGLSIAATCTVATLHAFEPPAAWSAAPLIGQCCQSFLASFKIWHMATVGGNLCMALPAGPMISLAAALEGVCVIWTPGSGERRLPVVDFVLGPQSTALAPGELLRSVELPLAALTRRTAFRRATLTTLGRSAALLIGTRSPDGAFVLTVTASTRRPVQLRFPAIPSGEALTERLATEIPFAQYYDDVHGLPDWRRHMTHELAEEIRRELAEGR